jgi:hypothetical protein
MDVSPANKNVFADLEALTNRSVFADDIKDPWPPPPARNISLSIPEND